MPLKGTNTNDYVAEDATFSLLLYGSYGSGKTLLTASAQQHPALRDLVYIDADPGLSSIEGLAGIENTNRIGFGNVSDLQLLPSYIKQNYPTTSTVVFDSITELVNIRLMELWGDRTDTDWRDYLTTKKNIMKILTNLRGAGYNIIMTATDRDETELIDKKPVLRKRRPDLPEKLFKQIAAFVDFMWHTYRTTDGAYNLLYMPLYQAGGAEFVAKTRKPSFVAQLEKIKRTDVKATIKIGQAGDDSKSYPNLSTLYTLYQSVLTKEEKNG